MMRTRPTREAGYTLAEMLVVVVILGLMSLITIPQFVAYQQRAKLRAGMGVLAGDLRNARQLAITRYWQVRIEFTDSKTYKFYYRGATSGTWNDLTQTELRAARINGVTSNWKTLPKPITFVTGDSTVAGTTYTAMSDYNSNTYPDVVFNWDGSAYLNSAGTQTMGSIKLSSPWTSIVQNQMVVVVYSSGKITTVGTHS